MMPITASSPIHGAQLFAASGSIGSAILMNPYVPSFSRIAGNSPQNPASPGSPRLAITQKPRIQPIFGACVSSPPSRDISRVP